MKAVGSAGENGQKKRNFAESKSKIDQESAGHCERAGVAVPTSPAAVPDFAPSPAREEGAKVRTGRLSLK
jgi:hypothetical protein